MRWKYVTSGSDLIRTICHFSLWCPSNLQLDPDQQICCNEWSKQNEFSLYKFIEAFRECFTTNELFLIRLRNITYTRNKTNLRSISDLISYEIISTAIFFFVFLFFFLSLSANSQ